MEFRAAGLLNDAPEAADQFVGATAQHLVIGLANRTPERELPTGACASATINREPRNVIRLSENRKATEVQRACKA